MEKIKSFTTLEQSKVLAKILPMESADMYYDYDFYKHELCAMIIDEQFNDTDVRAWSLAALLDVLPNGIGLFKTVDGEFYCLSEDYMTKNYDNPIDACVAMIEKLYI